MDKIIEIMARADIEWQGPGTPFEQLDKPVADAVRDRMRAIISALEAEGFSISAAVQDGWTFR
jgi:hypothetical protein